MDIRLLVIFTLFSGVFTLTWTGNLHGEKHKLLVQVPTHIRQHVHTVYKIVKVPVFVKETKGRQDHHEGHDSSNKVEHSGKFEHQHLHKHLHEHRGELKASPLHHHHYHTHEGGVGVNHDHKGSIGHLYHGKVAHGHSGTVDHDHIGFVGHYHGGKVGHQHKGGVGHYHGGLVGHTHEGNVGHKHEGIVGHTHLGFVGHGHLGSVDHEHAGLVGHGHKGIVGHHHVGDVGHGHDGSVGHGHAGHVSHGHGGYIGHDHNGRTSHVHASNIPHNHEEKSQTTPANGNLQIEEEVENPPEDKQQYYSIKPIQKPGYYEYTVGSPGQPIRDGFGPSVLGINEIASSIGKAIGEQSHFDADEIEEGSYENDGGSVEYIDARLLQQPHQYEVFENAGL